jgi:hypothetical protein
MQYFCKNQERRLKVSATTVVNGIDYLEVIAADQKTLEVHFLHPLPGQPGEVPGGGAVLTEDHIRIEGGVRIRNIEVDSAQANGNVLKVVVDNAGDFSMYTLRLVISPSDPEPPAGFDPQLSAVAFSFKANCPNDFDCKTELVCPEKPISDPRIDYLAKDYASFRRLMLDRMSLLMPEWTERNAADLEVALVELLAYTGDHLSYYQDAVATESYLFTARTRISARRHARLLDYHLHNGCNARTWVFVDVEAGSNADLATLTAGTVLLTKGPESEVMVPSSEQDRKVREKDVVVFETLHDLDLYHVHNQIDLYTWDDSSCCLPAGATRATLYREDQLPMFLQAGQPILFEEIAGAKTGRPADADAGHRHVVRLTRVSPRVDILHGLNVVDIEWDEADALPFPFCINARIGGVLERIGVVRGNMVLADHGLTYPDQALIPAEAPRNRNFRPRLNHRQVTVSVPYNHASASEIPANLLLDQNPHEAIPDIYLQENGDRWRPKRDLLASNRFQFEFVAEIESDQSVHLRFGDDVLGKKPAEGFRPLATYRIGNGPGGNVGAEAISRIVWDLGGIRTVRNPLPARGGKNAGTMEEARQYAPEAFRTQERAVTEADYVAKTELHPQVQKALARFRWTGSWHTVFLIIDRKDGLELDDRFKQEIIAHLEKYRMAGYDLEIRPPLFVPLELEMNVCVRAGYFRTQVKSRLLEVFSRFDLPDGSRGFFHPDAFTFGQPVYLSALYHRAMEVDGIESVEIKTLKRLGRPANLEKENGVLSPAENEILRLDNDPNFPENGKINFLMYGGL